MVIIQEYYKLLQFDQIITINIGYHSDLQTGFFQGPLPHTVPHFLQMIVENKVKIIVMLTKLKEKNEGIFTVLTVR
jgi:protein tyrosine phosphatase